METRTAKALVPVIRPELCTECLMCQITCSLYHTGNTRPADARVRVIAPPVLSHPTVVVSGRCDCPDREELCPRVCGTEALRFIPRGELLAALGEGWQAAPLEG